MDEKMRDVMARMKHFVQCAHTHTHARAKARTYTSVSHDVSRRSSRQILFRKIGLPLSSTTKRQQLWRIVLTYQYTRACVSASEKLFQDYHPNLHLLQHSISPFFLSRVRPRYLTNFRYIFSTTWNDVLVMIEANHWFQKFASPYNAR